MINSTLKSILLGCLLSTNAIAGAMGESYNEGGWPFVITLSGGPAWSISGESQTFYLQPDVQKSYIAQLGGHQLKLLSTGNGTHTLGTGELFLGMRGMVNSIIEGQLGLALSTTTAVTLKGDIYEDADPNFNNYYYSYKIRNSRLAIKGLVLYDTGYYDLYPYVSGSVGVGFNNSSSFSIIPKIYQEVPAPLFGSNMSRTLSFTLGTGIQMTLDNNWRIGMGYEFADWGASRLGIAPGQTVGTGLRLGHLHAQEFLLSASYLA